ncbi:MAG: alkaline phosphatase family protein [Chthoniobacterales bacterium]|nr:alkaline phosphatase family protein [Chthoniobacterales bacterium]
MKNIRIALVCCAALGAQTFPLSAQDSNPAPDEATTSPIKHVVVIYQENRSFDHYFGTYPFALNPPGEPAFPAADDTPSVNGFTSALLYRNYNKINPFRLGPAHAQTGDQTHEYTAEQKACNHGLMDKFVEFTGTTDEGQDPRQVMAYFDGNTVTALWNYAQHFVLSDNFYGTNFGPSTPGALNLISGQTHGATPPNLSTDSGPDTVDGSVIADPQPTGDIANTRESVRMHGRNVGNLLNAKGITWGWFEGGFRDPFATHIGSDGQPKTDYIPHHEPFQYYRSTANLQHLPPSSVAMIGRTDQANHQYDLVDFWSAAAAHHIPAVTYLKAAGYQDGHPGYSDPLAEQTFLVNTINALQKLPEWQNMAIIIAYDDADGWYDHVSPPIVQQSNTPEDAFSAPGMCGVARPNEFQARAGYGPRLPLLIISSFAKTNYVDHALTDQSSILRFVEDNWQLGRIGNQSFDEKAGSLLTAFDFDDHGHRVRPLFLDPTTGQPVK